MLDWFIYYVSAYQLEQLEAAKAFKKTQTCILYIGSLMIAALFHLSSMERSIFLPEIFAFSWVNTEGKI